MEIKNKLESITVIKELNLNVLLEIFLSNFNEKLIKDFLNKYPAEFYAIRDKEKSMSKKHCLNVKKEDVVKYCKDNELSVFTINISSYNYRSSQLLCGEICLHKNFTLDYILSNNSNFSVRNAYANPDFVGSNEYFESPNLKKINGLDYIIDYVFKYNLFDVIVEFTVFDNKIGKNKENVIIWELRTNY